MTKAWPPILRRLSEDVGYRVQAVEPCLGLELFEMDLSGWKLKLSNRTPVVSVRASDLEGSSTQHLLQILADLRRQRDWGRQTAVVLIEGDSRPLLSYTVSPLYNLVVIGQAEQERLVASRRPSGELLDLISAQVPISTLAPYETRAPVTGSRFFGREYEVQRILSNPDTNHAILGIRRIGKTSLLREVERIYREGGESGHVVYLDCSDLLSTEDYMREVVRKLNPRELVRMHLQQTVFWFPNFLERMAQAHRPKLVFFLDEIDNLVLMQRGDWELFRMLRASSNKGACQYILAGFREAMKEQYLLDSPFYNFCQEVRLSEFTRRQAHDLIVTPMENLRVHIRDRDEVVGRIYEETAGHPNLMQYYCMILLRRLDMSGEREISPESLIDVYSDEGFKGHLLTSFMQNTEKREKAIIYAVLMANEDAPVRGFTSEFIDTALRRQSIAFSQQVIEDACDVLVLAGILHRKGKEYFLTSPVFTKVLKRTYDLGYLFRKLKEDGL